MHTVSLNFALAQKENTSFTTRKDQSESLHNRYARYTTQILQRIYITTRISTSLTLCNSTVTSACQGSGLDCTPEFRTNLWSKFDQNLYF